LPRARFFYSLGGMEVQFTAVQEAQLAQLATKAGTDAAHLVKDAALRLLEEDARFVEAVKRGEDALGRGEYLTHDQVGQRLHRFLQP
jgi:hypothetical protein